MKRICGAILLTIVTIGLLAGCGEPAPTTGYVQEKSYDDPDTIDHPPIYHPGTTTCTGGYNKVPRTCTTSPGWWSPGWTEHDGPHWHFKLRNCDEKDKKGKPKCHEGWREVSEAEYNSYAINSHYPDAR